MCLLSLQYRSADLVQRINETCLLQHLVIGSSGKIVIISSSVFKNSGFRVGGWPNE